MGPSGEGIVSDDTVAATPPSPTIVRDGAPAIDVNALRIALIGYGEVGGIFGAALVKRGVAHVTAYDVLVHDASRAAAMRARADADGVRIADSATAATDGADLVISAVTASATRDAAQADARLECHQLGNQTVLEIPPQAGTSHGAPPKKVRQPKVSLTNRAPPG